MRKKMRGVTLLELMIVVVIVSILAALAYPSYRQYSARAKRNEAKAALLQIASMQERFYLQNNVYTNDMTNLGFPVAGGFITDSDSYTVSIAGANANNYTATATFRLAATDPDEAAKCLNFMVDGNLVKTSNPEPDCWSRSQ